MKPVFAVEASLCIMPIQINKCVCVFFEFVCRDCNDAWPATSGLDKTTTLEEAAIRIASISSLALIMSDFVTTGVLLISKRTVV